MRLSTQVRSVFLLTLLVGILWGVGFALGGVSLSIVFLALGLLMNLFFYWFSDRLALAMTGAKAVTPQEEPMLHGVVDELVQRVGMPKPKVYIIHSESPNAFATGRNAKHAAVAATTGIMQVMSREDLAGVMAHELSHVRNRDTLIATIVASIASAISWLSWMAMWSLFFGGRRGGRDQHPYMMLIMLAVIVLAPIAAAMVQMAISRQREYGADEGAARTFRKPMELASALERLEQAIKQRPMKVNPAMSHLFIVNPLRKGEGMNALFSTHPPIAERVRRLREMAYHP